MLHQTFNVCTSPVVQAAWDQGQELHIYGVVYSLKDGLIKQLVGPISKNGAFRPACDRAGTSKGKLGGRGVCRAGAGGLPSRFSFGRSCAALTLG